MTHQLLFYVILYFTFNFFLPSCFSKLEEPRMDFSKSSVDTIRMNQTHSFKLDLNLHQHILYPRVFPLLVFRGFHLACEYFFGLVVPECSSIAEGNLIPSVWGWVMEETKV